MWIKHMPNFSTQQRCDHNQKSQKSCWTTKKLLTLSNIFMWCHINVTLIKEICAKWFIWVLNIVLKII